MTITHRKRRLPPLNALPAFEAAARHQSFSKAAEELNVTHGAISRAVALIEERLNVPLFTRRNRRVILTYAGERLFQSTQRILDELETTAEEIHRHEQDSPFLVVSCEPSLAMRWLMPRLGDFQTQHPELSIDLRMAGGPIDLLESGCDIAIRRTDFALPEDYEKTHLFKETAGPVCTSHYWESLVQKKKTACLLHSRTRSSAWDDWSKASKQTIESNTHQYFDHFFYALQAAQNNLGIAIGSQPIIQDELQAQRLIAPLGLEPTGHDYVILALYSLQKDPRIEKFKHWLQTLIQENQE